jgi:putative NADPH-quinone reductase
MPKHIAVIQGHPDPAGGHLCNALADAYSEGALARGHSVSRIEIARIDFPVLHSQAEFEKGSLPPSLAEARDAILGADHLVLVFPLWLGTMPAIVKAFLEQVMRPGIAFAYQSKGFPRKFLTGRSARLVVTMGMPAFLYRWFYLAHGLRSLERNILKFVGIGPVRETLFGLAAGPNEAKRRQWLKRMRALGGRAA